MADPILAGLGPMGDAMWEVVLPEPGAPSVIIREVDDPTRFITLMKTVLPVFARMLLTLKY